jgi:acetyl esterase/lipase
MENGITFGKGGDTELKLDLARPKEGAGPFPALVFIHSGSWIVGTRQEFDYVAQQAAEKGYVAVTVDYRLTYDLENEKTTSPFPCQIYDVKCAVRWLRANAQKYNIDSNHIGAFGFSAGAHLALLLALTKPSDRLEGDVGNAGFSSAVQAAVSCGGPTSLITFPPNHDLIRFLGGTIQEVPEQYARASPVAYVRKDSPPVLLLQGDKDDEVPLDQAMLLDSRMKQAGASHVFIIKKGAGHQSFHTDKAVWDFLDKNLKNSWSQRVLRWFGLQ